MTEFDKLQLAFERFEKSFKELLEVPYSPPSPPSPPPAPVVPPAPKQPQNFKPEPHQRSGWLSPEDVAFLERENAKTDYLIDESRRKKQGW